MADANKVRLDKRQTPGARQSDGCLIALGLPFAGAGGFLLMLATQADPTAGSHPWLLALAGAILGGAGLLVVYRGVRAVQAVVRRKRTLRARPGEPWAADGWDPRGQRERPLRIALITLAVLGLLALILIPINWVAWRQPLLVKAAVGLLDLAALVGLAAWSYKAFRSFTYGAVHARFERFPYFLGETLDLGLACRGGFYRLQNLVVTLRHIRVASERVDRTLRAVHYEEWAETQRFDASRLQVGGELRVSFQLPSGDYGTRLGEAHPDKPQPRYWELELAGQAPGIDLHARFPLPVYART